MNNKSTLLLVSAIFFNLLLNAQPPSIQWQKCFGGSNSDYLENIIATNDGGFILAGSSNSNNADFAGINNHAGFGGFLDVAIIKTDYSGNINWSRCYGGTLMDAATDILQTADGGYLVAGYSNSNDGDLTGVGAHGNYDLWIFKINLYGNIEWQRSYGGASDDIGFRLINAYDGGYFAYGTSNSTNGDINGNHGGNDCCLFKLNSLGYIEWQKCFGGSLDDYSRSIIHAVGGGYILTGITNSVNGDVLGNHGNFDSWIVKVDDLGNIGWQKCIGGSNSDQATSIIKTSDNGYILAGNTKSEDGDMQHNIMGIGTNDAMAAKLDSNGLLQWVNFYGGEGDDYLFDVCESNDRGFVLTGSSNSSLFGSLNNHGNSDDMLIKVDSAGYQQWEYEYGGTDIDNAFSLIKNADGSYIIAGYTTSNDFDISGGNHGEIDTWVVKLSADINAIAPITNQTFQVYPNPAKEYAMVQLPDEFIGAKYSLADATGREVANGIITTAETTLHLNNLPAGVYTFTAAGATKKIAKF